MQAGVIIEGITEDGKQFRPSDWAERLSCVLATFNGHRIVFSPMLCPIRHNNEACIFIAAELESTHPELFQEIMEFAHKNKLKICGK